MSAEVRTDPVIVGLHIPKCAGLTLLRHVQRQMQSEHISQCTALYENYVHDRREFTHISNKGQLRFLFGHHVHEEMIKQLGSPIFLFTGLREPLDRMRSELNYTSTLFAYLEKPFNAEEYIAHFRNPMCEFILRRFPQAAGSKGSPAQRALKVLDHFHFVYFPASFYSLCMKITTMLDIPAVTKNENVSKFPVNYVIDRNNFLEDINFYNEAYAKWGPGSPDQGSDMADLEIKKLQERPRDVEGLRNFFYGMTFDEYRNWGVLEGVIASRKAIIQEYEAEIKLYERFATLAKR